MYKQDMIRDWSRLMTQALNYLSLEYNLNMEHNLEISTTKSMKITRTQVRVNGKVQRT